MALLDDILTWSQKGLTLWQRDAARRLLLQPNLTQQDMDELYALLKAAQGLPCPEGLKAIPLAAEHLPAKAAAGKAVILNSIKNLKFVNRIASEQALKFSPTGMTVIYGGNGAGKSGYSRVLKKACRARDQMEEVLTDATDPSGLKNTPEATFDVTLDGKLESLIWRRGVTPPDPLSTVAVFDARCARVYLTAEQAVAYMPYGLDVVENLANKVLPGLTDRLTKEISTINIDAEPFRHLHGDTAVGKLVAGVSAKTDPDQVTKLATMTAEEGERLAALDKALAEMDPKAKVKEVRLRIQRLEGLVKRIDSAAAWVSDAAIAKLKEFDEAAVAALQAEKVAAEKFRSGETLLPGTGDSVWRELFESARRYSTAVAYPGHAFPHTGDGANCVLCQQPLTDGAQRLLRFGEFIQQDAAKVAQEKRTAVAAAIRKIEAASVAVEVDDAIRDELIGLNPETPQAIQAYGKSMEARRQAMLAAIESHDWSKIPALEADPRTGIKEISAKQSEAAAELDKAGDEANRLAQEKERNELRARTTLGASASALIALIERLKFRAQLELCKNDLKTRGISEKSREFSESAVTATLQKALQEEFGRLGVSRISTRLEGKNVKGVTKYKLLLNLPSAKNIEDILSEGEQRAIALGSFLAELQLAGHKGAIVFDDPVSSLDHYNRKRVAHRLVEEAKHRQVIVLTHDTTFLGELRDHIEKEKADHLMQHLEWRGGNPGHVAEGLPWIHKSYADRIDKHEKAQKRFEKLPWPAYPDEELQEQMRVEYSGLRATLERVIQDVVFCGVVQRYRDWIKVDQLSGVVGFEAGEYAEISRIHKKCCDVTEAHDHSSAKLDPVPSAAELDKDIKDLQAVIKVINDRKAKLKNG